MSDALADLDPALYVQPPVLDVPAGIALGSALLTAADPTLPMAVQHAATDLQTAVLVLQRRFDEQQDADDRPTVDARSADLRLDRAWVAVGKRLEVLLDLPGHLPQAEQAAVLYRRLFPEELAFLNLPFRRQWAESELRLRTIEQEDMESQLDVLVGGFVLDELRDAHEEYGRVLGIDDPKAALGTPARLAEGLRMLRDSIAAYGLQLVAAAHANPDCAQTVRASLRPITNVRWGLEPHEGLAITAEALEPSEAVETSESSEADASEELESETPPDATSESEETSSAEATKAEAPPVEAEPAKATPSKPKAPKLDAAKPKAPKLDSAEPKAPKLDASKPKVPKLDAPKPKAPKLDPSSSKTKPKPPKLDLGPSKGDSTPEEP